MKLALIGAALCGVAALSGCATQNGIPTPVLTPAASAEVQAALDSYCPVLSTAQSQATLTPALDTTDVSAGLKLLAEVCPPNPAPTNGGVVLVDIIQAYVTIEPLLSKSVKASASARFEKADATYHLRAKYHLNIPRA